jgi:predicted ATPase
LNAASFRRAQVNGFKTQSHDQFAGTVSQAGLAGADAHLQPRGLSILPSFLARRFRAELRSGRHHHRRRKRHGQIDFTGIAALAGFDEAGGGKGYMPIDHSLAIEAMGGQLSKALRASWLPRITGGGWFFRAESFFSVARYLDEAAREPLSGPPPDFLSHSHGEGFLRFFQERCQRQGVFIFDEPESALSPSRQIEFLKLLWRMDQSKICQVIMATHSPMLMAYPDARLLRLTIYGLDDRFHKTDHNSTFVESDQARISQGHLTTSVPANIRFEPRKRPTRARDD